jgi:hypothetical protein
MALPLTIYCALLVPSNATLLVDEADNMEIAAGKLLKAVLNGGHRRGALLSMTLTISTAFPARITLPTMATSAPRRPAR